MSETTENDRASRVLIVDDDRVMRVMASEALAAIGFSVEEAKDGESALEAIAASPPDLVLLDVQLPGMNGFEACAALRREANGRDLPVLIATGITHTDAIERAFEAGATDFIHKPFDSQYLQHRARFAVRASRAIGDLRSTLFDLQQSRTRLAHAQRLAQIGHWEWTPEEGEMLWSEETHSILEIPELAGEARYDALLGAVHPEDRDRVEKALSGVVHEQVSMSLDHRIITPLEIERIVHHTAEISSASQDGELRIAGTVQDITERSRALEQIHYLASYDSLTSLPNRKMLTANLRAILDRNRKSGAKAALMLLDLDRYKRVNETLGHEIGDEFIKAISARLLEAVRIDDRVGRPGSGAGTIGRLTGDQFCVILNRISSADDAAQVARRLRDRLSSPLTSQGHDLVLSASIGIAVSPTDGDDHAALMRNAEAAMHHAKKQGGNGVQFFSGAMNERATRALAIEKGLRHALERNEIFGLYQAKLDVASNRIIGAEALMRWNSPDLGLVPPDEFIPLAEETGVIGALGEWMLRNACTQAREWQRRGLPPLHVAVNVSSHQVRKPGTVEIVRRALEDSGLDPSLLELEITESSLIGDEPEVADVLQRIREMGVRLALDDFGTGYSSLTHLTRFPIDVIKIDRSFVMSIGESVQAGAIVAAVIAMGHRLDMSVVAEGVETATQEQFLRDNECTVLQGYGISKPIEPEQFEALVLERQE